MGITHSAKKQAATEKSHEAKIHAPPVEKEHAVTHVEEDRFPATDTPWTDLTSAFLTAVEIITLCAVKSLRERDAEKKHAPTDALTVRKVNVMPAVVVTVLHSLTQICTEIP